MSGSTENKAILLTGAAGFIGSYLAEEFLRAYPERRVIGYDVLAYCASKENLADAMDNKRFVFVRGDICDAACLQRTLETYDVGMIVHCAAESHVDNSFGNSLHFTDVNVRGTHNLLECARTWHMQGRLERFLHVSTDEVYGTTDEGDLHHEGSLLNPTNPYSASKAAAEMYARAYLTSYNMPIVVTRSNNIFGPRQHPEKVIPRFVQRVLHGNLPQIDGTGEQERTFLYVTDVARAISTVLKDGVIGETYNIGCNTKLTIGELAEKVVAFAKRLHGKSFASAWEFSGTDRPFNDLRYRLDWSKIRGLGWRPTVGFDLGLERIFAWHSKKNMRRNHWNDSQWACMVEDA